MTLKNPKYQWRGIEVGERMLEDQEAEEEAAREEAVAKGETPPTRQFEPTPEQRKLVNDMATAGMPLAHICLMVRWPHNDRPITYKTLCKHFPNELFEGAIKADVTVVGSMFAAIKAGNVQAMIFWLERRCGWIHPTQKIEITGKDGEALNSGVLVMPTTLAPEDWERVMAEQQGKLVAKAGELIATPSKTIQ